MESVDWCMNPVPHTWNCSETYFILSLFVDGVGPKYSPIISAGLSEFRQSKLRLFRYRTLSINHWICNFPITNPVSLLIGRSVGWLVGRSVPKRLEILHYNA